MGTWVEIEVWRQRRAELIREAQERALAREARKVREAFAAAEERPAIAPPTVTQVPYAASEEADVLDAELVEPTSTRHEDRR